MMMKITSEQNRQVKELASLGTRKGRAARGTFLVEGVRAVSEALSAGADVRRLVVEDGRGGEELFAPLVGACLGAGIQVLEMPRALVKKVCGMETPQGVAAEVARPADVKLSAGEFAASAVLACGVRDPRNAGLLARTVAAAGAAPLIFSAGSVDPFHPQAAQTAMGTIFRLKTVTDVAAGDAIGAARAAGLGVVATAVAGGTPAAEWLKSKPGRFLLVLGGEAGGLDREVMGLADIAVTLPLHNGVESLNVAVSAGILLYAAALVNAGGE